MPNLVKMPDGEGETDEALARRIQALRPDTSKSVALRKQVQQIAIGRPGRDQIFRRTIRNRDPRTAALVVHRVECRNEYPARAGLDGARKMRSNHPMVKTGATPSRV
jgi:hypothetical protein